MPQLAWRDSALHVIAKPIGPVCNLDCAYCFYLHKTDLYPQEEHWRMSDQTLEAYVRQYLEAQPAGAAEIDFAFQGGEPTLMGLDFFRRVLELQRKHVRSNQQVRNSLQTNGLLLDDAWCEFLAANHFLVGLSLDGPADLHDKFRRDKAGRPTQQRVLQTLQRLKKHGVAFNVLTCVNRHNADHPRRVYRFLREQGVEFMQFIPIVERLPGVELRGDPNSRRPEELVSVRSVLPEQYGRFLTEVFGEWLFQDVGRVFVRDFDQALSAWVGAGTSLCVYAETCGRATAIEHNGDLYSCDHFVDEPHKLGSIHQQSIAELANGPQQEQFGQEKRDSLPDFCRQCPHLFVCHGACPKDRFLATPDGQPGLNYLCAGYREFFAAIDPVMQAMAVELRAGRDASAVMHRVRAERRQAMEGRISPGRPVGRNDPCPCGSGRKYKACCMRR